MASTSYLSQVTDAAITASGGGAMAENELPNLEQDPRFPSGPWTGFFLQYWLPGRHTTNLAMTIRDGQLAGTGADWVGAFEIEGDYDTVSGKCQWIKRYIGKHSVAY